MTKNFDENRAPSNLEKTFPFMRAANTFRHLGRPAGGGDNCQTPDQK